MKIIKKGTKTPPDKIVYITKCKTCGCKFTYMEKDVMLSWFREEYLKEENIKYKNQQKEFIEYLENEININPYNISDYAYEDIINKILSKYKEIIGGLDYE